MLMKDCTGIIIDVTDDEHIMIDYCNTDSCNTHCVDCPYSVQCIDFEYKHGTIPFSFEPL